MQTIKNSSDLVINPDSSDLCPKCQNLLSPEGMETVVAPPGSIHRTHFQMIYSCPHCGAKFAFFPVTTLQLFEVEPVEA